MIGYGALRDPTVFGARNGLLSVDEIVRQYVATARRHSNRLVDVQRHIGWLTKHVTSEEDRRALFGAQTLDELAIVMRNWPATKIDLQLPPSNEARNSNFKN